MAIYSNLFYCIYISGCGNGYTLIELAKEGFTNLLGIDYCEEAILLAKKISQMELPHIKYQVNVQYSAYYRLPSVNSNMVPLLWQLADVA